MIGCMSFNRKNPDGGAGTSWAGTSGGISMFIDRELGGDPRAGIRGSKKVTIKVLPMEIGCRTWATHLISRWGGRISIKGNQKPQTPIQKNLLNRQPMSRLQCSIYKESSKSFGKEEFTNGAGENGAGYGWLDLGLLKARARRREVWKKTRKTGAGKKSIGNRRKNRPNSEESRPASANSAGVLDGTVGDQGL